MKPSVCFLHSATRLVCHALCQDKLKSLKQGARWTLTSFRLCTPGAGGWLNRCTGEQETVSVTKADKLSQATGAYMVSGVNSPKLSSDFHKHSML